MMQMDEKAYSDDEDALSAMRYDKSNGFMHQVQKRQTTDQLLANRPIKVERRHSADIILAKPSTKNINSIDNLNRMVISLRAKIATYKEDLRIAGELGQKLFSQNAAKDIQIEQNRLDIQQLRLMNQELSMRKDQLLQTNQIDREHTKRLETDLQRQRSSTTHVQTQYQEQNIPLKAQLQHALSDVRHLQQLNETQQLEIETLETRNEQIGTDVSEMIDDLSRELAEERDGLSTLKHKYSKLRNEQTKLKINYEKRGTEINNLKKQIQEKDLKIQLLANANDTVKTKTNEEAENMNKHQIKLLYRQIDNYKDEMEGISKHLEHCKQYLKTTMHHLESVGLLMQSPLDETQDGPTIETLYNHCKNARQFLGIMQSPPDPVYPEESPEAPPPELPVDRSPEPLPNDDDEPSNPEMPRERTPSIHISARETVPLSVPDAPKSRTPPPVELPTQQNIMQSPNMPQSAPKPKLKMINKPSLPPMEPPSEPIAKPQKIPLPRPKTPKQTAKTYNLGVMPQSVNIMPSLPAPAMPLNRQQMHHAPTPVEVRSNPQRFSSAMSPKFFPAPNQPQSPNIPAMPSSPKHTTKYKINATPKSPDIALPAPRTPSFKEPMLPSIPSEPTPVSRTYNVGLTPDEKPVFSAPSLPVHEYHIVLPQEPESKQNVKISADALMPPTYPKPSKPAQPPMLNPTPSPREPELDLMESMRSGVSSNNETKPKMKKKKSLNKKKKTKPKQKKQKKERDSMEEQKQHLTVFFTKYSDNKHWQEGDKENGVQKYILQFAEREPLNARMAFLYSMTLYLGQIVGVNKRCISHAFMLFKSVRAQIDTLCEEFALILQTLEHHNDDKLWKYVYSFLYNAAAYFKHIQRFVGTRCPVDNPKKYSRALKSGSRDLTNYHGRRESSFRKLSGLSEVSGVSTRSIDPFQDEDSNHSHHTNPKATPNRMVYGSAHNDVVAIASNVRSSHRDNKKHNKKKKKSSYNHHNDK